ncbi:MAG: HAD-IIIA family hydrolase [Pseudomonadaceae bacterium]|nr:HAD-IIIA family hydrolase [Pseudomonadaceae bacterium]
MALSGELRRRAAAIELVIFDVDGVLTDGQITYDSTGAEHKSFHVQDGSAIKLMMRAGIQIGIITGRKSEPVRRRAEELGITYLYQGNEDKRGALADISKRSGISTEHMAHCGDDLADLALFERVGLAVSVPNGHPEVRRRADIITKAAGGQGVARDLCELLLRARGVWAQMLAPDDPQTRPER